MSSDWPARGCGTGNSTTRCLIIMAWTTRQVKRVRLMQNNHSSWNWCTCYTMATAGTATPFDHDVNTLPPPPPPPPPRDRTTSKTVPLQNCTTSKVLALALCCKRIFFGESRGWEAFSTLCAVTTSIALL